MSLHTNNDMELHNQLTCAMNKSIDIIEKKYTNSTKKTLKLTDIIEEFYKQYPKDPDVLVGYYLSKAFKELNVAIFKDKKRAHMFMDHK